jgi:hypothetical protein
MSILQNRSHKKRYRGEGMNPFDWQIEEIEAFCSDPVKDIEYEMNASFCDPDGLAIPYEVGCCG